MSGNDNQDSADLAKGMYFGADAAYGTALGELSEALQQSGGEETPAVTTARENVNYADGVRGDALQQLARQNGQDV